MQAVAFSRRLTASGKAARCHQRKKYFYQQAAPYGKKINDNDLFWAES
jgi:hypothetical protein